jgi:hypothetical protein
MIGWPVFTARSREKCCLSAAILHSVSPRPFSAPIAAPLRLKRIIRVLDAGTGTDRITPIKNAERVISLSFTPDSSRVSINWGSENFTPGAASVWDANTGAHAVEFTQHMDGVISAVFTADSRIAATSGEDGYAFVWKADTGEALLEALPLSSKIKSVKFSKDGQWLAGCSWNEAQLWDVDTGRALTLRFPIPGRGRFDRCGIVAGKGRLWVQASRGLYFWDLPQAAGDADELIALAHQLGIMIPVGIAWNPAAYPLAKLRARCTEERQRAQARLTLWHEQQARLFENPTDPDWFAARFHLEKLLQRNPESSDLRVRLATVTQQLGARTKAADTNRDSQTTP